MDAFRFLGSEPSPQGVVFASETIGRMIGGFLPDAYPVNFREYGPVDRNTLKALVGKDHFDGTLRSEIARNQVRYILLERTLPLAQALKGPDTGFTLVYENPDYGVWQAEQIVPARTGKGGTDTFFPGSGL